MNVVDLDGNHSIWQLTGHMAKASKKSSYHIQARELLNEIFPTLQTLEEVPICVRRRETLYLDFYLPLKKLCVEVHGEQHYKFVGHYHPTKLAFFKGQKRDREKVEWCELNGIRCVELPHYETVEQWKGRILGDD